LKRLISHLAASAANNADGECAEHLIDGIDRDLPDECHGWTGAPGSPVEFRWDHPVSIKGLRIIFDSNLANNKQMPHTYPQSSSRSRVPETLVRRFAIEALDDAGHWSQIYAEENNYQRLVRLPLNVITHAIRLIPHETWGAKEARLFALEPLGELTKPSITPVDGPSFASVRAAIDPRDLAPPAKSPEAEKAHAGRAA
jgi:hypothetical protein